VSHDNSEGTLIRITRLENFAPKTRLEVNAARRGERLPPISPASAAEGAEMDKPMCGAIRALL
jgi:hypothetical protein